MNEYKHVVNSEGLRGGAGVGHTTHTVPSAFAEDIARENREKIERLKEAVNERMIAHATLFSDDVGN